MSRPFDYSGSPLPVREDIPKAHRRTWQKLAQPGNWWTGTERIAIAAESRQAATCPLCAERVRALSPMAVAGEHATAGQLPEAAVEAIHRIATDPGRLTRDWLTRLHERGLSDGHYVELAGVAAVVVSIDSFHRALGMPPEPLPEPVAGEPSRYRPPGARLSEAWVPTVSPGRLSDGERDLYGGLPVTTNVLKALSLVPDAVAAIRALGGVHYLPELALIDPASNGGRALDRPQMELLATRVSALNQCFF